MGILGNNAQTELQAKTELTGGKAYKGISGFAEQDKPKEDEYAGAGPGSIPIVKPGSKESKKESALLESMKGLKDMAETMAPQLQNMAETMAPQLENIASQFNFGGQ